MRTAHPVFLFLLAMVVGAITPSARAQSGGFDDRFGIVSAPDQPAVTITAQPAMSTVRPGEVFPVAVILDHAPSWHTNLNEPIVPEAMGDFTPVPTVINVTASELGESAGPVFKAGPIQWPEPYAAKVDFLFTGDPIDYLVFSGKAVVFVPVVVADDAPSGEHQLTLAVGYQACDDTMCLQPEEIVLNISITVDPAAASSETDVLFASFDASVFADPDAWDLEATIAESKFLGLIAIPGPDTLVGVAVLALLAAVGGFVLNLTPCVLPVIPIKVMTISQHAGEKKSRAIVLGLWMALGVVAFWVGIGIPVALFAGAVDPSQLIFGRWYVTLLIGAVILAMGVGIMGVFSINLPQSVYAINPKADSPQGSFMFGVMTAVLGLPCFGFVAGALLAGAATMPPAVVLVIFGAMGAGMALPYLVLSVFPALVKSIPRTGPASELVKQIMGLLMIGAAAYFIGSGVIALLSDMNLLAQLPWWAKAVHWWVIGLSLIAAGGWLFVQTLRITKRPGPRLSFSIVTLLLVTAGTAAAVDRTSHLAHNFWVDYSPEALTAALENGQVVVLDFTAEWCVNCKALEATVLSRDPVKPELLSAGVVPMVADLTSKNAPGWDRLRELGQTGIPLLVVYAPGSEDPSWMSNAYTPDQVVRAIESARSGQTATASAAP